MASIVIDVNNGENLARLLKAFPTATVRACPAEVGQDAWKVQISRDCSPIIEPLLVSLKARLSAAKEYTMNKDLKIECRILERQITALGGEF